MEANLPLPGALSFPYEGKALTHLKLRRDCPVGRGSSNRGERSVAAQPAGRSPSPAGVGWRGSPLRTIYGADSGFRRTTCLHPRRAQRRAQVCGEIAAQHAPRGERVFSSPHPPRSGPPSPKGSEELGMRSEELAAASEAYIAISGNLAHPDLIPRKRLPSPTRSDR